MALVPGAVFSDCEAGPLQIAPSRRKASNADGAADAAADAVAELERTKFNAAVQEAQALKPSVVQYAVLVPAPDEHLSVSRKVSLHAPAGDNDTRSSA